MLPQKGLAGMGKTEKAPVADVAPLIVDRATAAKMLNCSLRTVSQLAHDGILVRVARPGTGKKTLGFSLASIQRFAAGEAGKGVPHADT